MKGIDANNTAGDAIINITNATVQATDAFLTGLIIPNPNMWVTMDTRPGGGFAGKGGDVSRVDDTLRRTEVGHTLLDAEGSDCKIILIHLLSVEFTTNNLFFGGNAL